MPGPQFVQSNQDNFAAGSPITCTYTTSNPVQGNLLICAATTGSSATTLSISDTLNGSTWSQILNQVSDSNTYLWAVQNTATGADTVSLVSSAPADIIAVSILEYSGFVIATDGALIAALATGSTQTTPSLTLHDPIELIIAFMRGNSGKALPNSPLTTRAQCTLAGSTYFGVGDRILSSISNPESESFATNGESNGTGAIGIAAFTLPILPASTFSPAGGIYSDTQHVSLLNADSAVTGFAQYYTTDGSTPTTGSTLYTGPITVAKPTTIKVLATATYYLNSPVASASFTILGGSSWVGIGGPALAANRGSR